MHIFPRCFLLSNLLPQVARFSILHQSCQIKANFEIFEKNYVILAGFIKSFTDKTRRQCYLECISDPECKSVNVQDKSGHGCELYNKTIDEPGVTLKPKEGWTHWSVDQNTANVSFDFSW